VPRRCAVSPVIEQRLCLTSAKLWDSAAERGADIPKMVGAETKQSQGRMKHDEIFKVNDRADTRIFKLEDRTKAR